MLTFLSEGKTLCEEVMDCSHYGWYWHRKHPVIIACASCMLTVQRAGCRPKLDSTPFSPIYKATAGNASHASRLPTRVSHGIQWNCAPKTAFSHFEIKRTVAPHQVHLHTVRANDPKACQWTKICLPWPPWLDRKRRLQIAPRRFFCTRQCVWRE